MARFSLPFVQIGAALGAAAMALAGQWLAREEGAASERPAVADGETIASEAGAVAPSLVGAAAAPTESAGSAEIRPAFLPSGRGTERDAPVATAAPSAPGEAPDLAHVRPRLAVIIDDVGHDVETARALMALPVTLAILPYAEAAPVLAREARSAGRDVFVHLPLEPEGLDDPGPGAITTALSSGEIALRVDAALARVPGAAGLNTHMGSRATRHPATVAALVSALSGRGLAFVDSLTHPASLAGDAARAAGIAALDRDVFLDAPGADPEAQLDAALALALERGQAIAIGHPYPATLAALASLQAKADAAGVELVTVAALARRAEAPS
ncbi:MAG: divergent polysaccharide deacetylase family protein [Oceanicaulis sp.]